MLQVRVKVVRAVKVGQFLQVIVKVILVLVLRFLTRLQGRGCPRNVSVLDAG